MSKTILVTQAHAGFGKAICETLAQEGYSVIATMPKIKTTNRVSAHSLSDLSNIEVVEMDMQKEESVYHAIKAALKKYGQVDGLITNSGTPRLGLFEAMSITQLRNLFELNVFGTVRTFQALLPSMRERKCGLIINVANRIGLPSSPYSSLYEMSMASVDALMEGIRTEVARFNIEVISIHPGPLPVPDDNPSFIDDQQIVIDEYGSEFKNSFNAFKKALDQKVDSLNVSQREVASSIRQLIQMKKGTRPYHTLVNRISEESERKWYEENNVLRENWLKEIGWPVLNANHQ